MYIELGTWIADLPMTIEENIIVLFACENVLVLKKSIPVIYFVNVRANLMRRRAHD